MDTTTWKKVKLGDICDIDIGEFVKKTEQDDNAEYPVFNGGVTNTGYYKNYNRIGPKVIISARGSAGFVNFIEGKYWAGNSLYSVSPKNRNCIDIKYLYYVIKANQSNLQSLSQSSTLPAVNKSHVVNLEITLPPLADQIKIAKLLSDLDTLISTTEQKSDALRKQKAQLMTDIFSSDRERANWSVVKLGDICDVKNGYTPSKSNPEYWEDGTVPWYRVDDIRENGRILTDALQHVNVCAVKGGKLIPANSIMISTSATIGEYALTKVPCLGNQRFAFFTVKDRYKNNIDNIFLLYSFETVSEWCKANASMGSTFLQVQTAELKKCTIQIPPLPEQQQIAKLLSEYDELIAVTNEQADILKKSKTQIMTDIFA